MINEFKRVSGISVSVRKAEIIIHLGTKKNGSSTSVTGYIGKCHVDRIEDLYIYSKVAVEFCDYFRGIKNGATEENQRAMEEQAEYYLMKIEEVYSNFQEVLDKANEIVVKYIRRLRGVAEKAGYYYREDRSGVSRKSNKKIVKIVGTGSRVKFIREDNAETAYYTLDKGMRAKLEKVDLVYNTTTGHVLIEVNKKTNMSLEAFCYFEGDLKQAKKNVQVVGEDSYNLCRANLEFKKAKKKTSKKKDYEFANYSVPAEVAELNAHVKQLIDKEGVYCHNRRVVSEASGFNKYYAYLPTVDGVAVMGMYETRHQAQYAVACADPAYRNCLDDYKLADSVKNRIEKQVEKYLKLNDCIFTNEYYSRNSYHVLKIVSKCNDRVVEVKFDTLLPLATKGYESLNYLKKKHWVLNHQGYVVDSVSGKLLEEYLFCVCASEKVVKPICVRRYTGDDAYDYRADHWKMYSEEKYEDGGRYAFSRCSTISGVNKPLIRVGNQWKALNNLSFVGKNANDKAKYAATLLKMLLNIPMFEREFVRFNECERKLTNTERLNVEKFVEEQLPVVRSMYCSSLEIR